AHTARDAWANPEEHGEPLRRPGAVCRLELRRNEAERRQRAQPDLCSAHIAQVPHVPAEYRLYVEQLREVAAQKAQLLGRLLHRFGPGENRVAPAEIEIRLQQQGGR